MKESIERLSIFKRLPRGFSFFERVCGPLTPTETAWFINEESEWINVLGASPLIGIRSGVIEHGAILLVPFLIRMGSAENENLYETWMNPHSEDRASIEDLCIQPKITLHLYGEDATRLRSIRIENSLQRLFRELLGKVSVHSPWSEEKFDEARSRLFIHYPAPADLWNALAPMKKESNRSSFRSE